MQATGLRSHVWNNAIKSLFLLATFPVLVAILTHAGLMIATAIGMGHLAETAGMLAALRRVAMEAWRDLPAAMPWVLLGCGTWFVVAWFVNVGIVSAATGARSVSRTEEPELYNLLENLCISRGMTMPKLRVMETSALNAYASGVTKSQYTVAVTRGLMQTLSKDELEAVLAHELAHIEHGDVRLMMVASVFVGIFSFIAEAVLGNGRGLGRMLASATRSKGGNKKGGGGGAVLLAVVVIGVVILVLVRLLATLARLMISRTREYMADAQAVLTTRNPDAMMSALAKISGRSNVEGVPSDVRPMFFDNGQGLIGGLFATHPPIDDRIRTISRYARLPPPEKPDGGPWGDFPHYP
jgi:heat shock protein HtpX|nr:M48 family metallopeptidase [Neorhizobium tomejilense]